MTRNNPADTSIGGERATRWVAPTFGYRGLASIAAAGMLAWGAWASDALQPESSRPRGRDRELLREGTELVQVSGHFRITGDRVTFSTQAGRRQFVVLENLNLERIVAEVEKQSQPVLWKVTATVTEYRGSNFLFVRHAGLLDPPERKHLFSKSRLADPEPVPKNPAPGEAPLP